MHTDVFLWQVLSTRKEVTLSCFLSNTDAVVRFLSPQPRKQEGDLSPHHESFGPADPFPGEPRRPGGAGRAPGPALPVLGRALPGRAEETRPRGLAPPPALAPGKGGCRRPEPAFCWNKRFPEPMWKLAAAGAGGGGISFPLSAGLGAPGPRSQ